MVESNQYFFLVGVGEGWEVRGDNKKTYFFTQSAKH